MATLSSLRVDELAPSLYEIATTLGDKRLATWAIVGGDDVALVDVGVASTPRDVLAPALERLGAAPADVGEIVITHADVDHFGGLAAARALFPHARIRASAADRPLIERWKVAVDRRYGWYRAHGLDYEAAVWEVLPTLTGPDTPLDGTLEPGDRLRCGELDFELLALPGHTAGHIGLWEPRLGLALVADALLADGVPDTSGALASPPPYVSAPDYRATLDRLDGLGASQLRASHFAPELCADPPGFIEASRTFADRLEQAILDALAGGPQSVAALWRQLEPRLGPYPALSVELARSIHSQLEDLAARGLVAERGGGWCR